MRIDKAREAFKKRDIEDSKKYHSREMIKTEPWHKIGLGKYLSDAVYGALDGIVTTFAVVAGAVGANLSPIVILIIGFANLIGDGLSMALGNYLGSKSEKEFIEKERKREMWEVENIPDGEREEIREIYSRKGFHGKKLDSITKLITSDKNVWVDTMMIYELGLLEDDKNPAKSGFTTFFSFVFAGLFPLIIYILPFLTGINFSNQFWISVTITLLTLFIIGSFRSKITGIYWIRAGLEMMIVGGLAALGAYFIGYLFSLLI